MEFPGLVLAIYTLRVVATNSRSDKTFIKSRFEVTDDAEHCTLHLINDGVSVNGHNATVDFTGRGPVDAYLCHLDKMDPYQCKQHMQVKTITKCGSSYKGKRLGVRKFVGYKSCSKLYFVCLSPQTFSTSLYITL